MKLKVKKDFVYNGNHPELAGKVLFKQDELITETQWLANMYLEAKSSIDGQFHLIAQPFMKNHPLEDIRFTEHFEILADGAEGQTVS